MKNKSLNLILLPSIALFLSACGGGGSSSSNTDQNSIIDTPVVNTQPTELSAVNWQSARVLQKRDPMETTVEIVGSELSINVISDDISQGDHLQIYINSDNKAETGFQFSNQAWEDSGVDYLIEDGDLFKSTANNSGWNWNTNVGAIDYTLNNNTAIAKIDLSLLGDICNNLNIGVITRDEFWDIATFSPASSQMQTFNVSYCNTEISDTKSPLMSLLGANPLTVTTGNEFIDPGATAIDEIDGDITSRITSESNVNTNVAGTYVINYFSTDISGNSSAIGRQVIVNNITPPEGIEVDGNINDWNDVPTFSSSANGIMKVSDDEEKIYILVASSNLGDNVQVLMDTDNNVVTGLKLSSQTTTWLGGADYMIENNSLDKSKSNNLWSWDFGIAPIEYIKSPDVLEISIKKSDLNVLANKIPMGFVSRTGNWNVNYILPEQALSVYTLKFPVAVNPVILDTQIHLEGYLGEIYSCSESSCNSLASYENTDFVWDVNIPKDSTGIESEEFDASFMVRGSEADGMRYFIGEEYQLEMDFGSFSLTSLNAELSILVVNCFDDAIFSSCAYKDDLVVINFHDTESNLHYDIFFSGNLDQGLDSVEIPNSEVLSEMTVSITITSGGDYTSFIGASDYSFGFTEYDDAEITVKSIQ